MKLSLARHTSTEDLGRRGLRRRWSVVFLIMVLVLAAWSLLGLTFISGGVAYRAGLRPASLRLFVEDQFVFLTTSRPSLPTLVVDMSFNNLEKVRAKREEALAQHFLSTSDGDFVPATISFEGRAIRVKMRLKGDSDTHWNTDKWSCRIHTRGDARVLGIKRFSIQAPHNRAFHYGQGFLENMRF